MIPLTKFRRRIHDLTAVCDRAIRNIRICENGATDAEVDVASANRMEIVGDMGWRE